MISWQAFREGLEPQLTSLMVKKSAAQKTVKKTLALHRGQGGIETS